METLRSGWVKIRKPHKCWGCCDQKEPGTKMNVVVSTDGGKAISCYWCEVCQAYWDLMDDDYGSDGVAFGCMQDGGDHYLEFKAKFLNPLTSNN